MFFGLPWWRSGWESACQCRGHGFEPWSGRIPHAAEQLGPWATITEPVSLEPVLRNKRGRDSERPAHRDEEWPPLAATRESPRTETKTQHRNQSINQSILKKKKRKKKEAPLQRKGHVLFNKLGEGCICWAHLRSGMACVYERILLYGQPIKKTKNKKQKTKKCFSYSPYRHLFVQKPKTSYDVWNSIFYLTLQCEHVLES